MRSRFTAPAPMATAMNTIELIKEIIALRADLLIVSHPHAKHVINAKLVILETRLISGE